MLEDSGVPQSPLKKAKVDEEKGSPNTPLIGSSSHFVKNENIKDEDMDDDSWE